MSNFAHGGVARIAWVPKFCEKSVASATLLCSTRQRQMCNNSDRRPSQLQTSNAVFYSCAVTVAPNSSTWLARGMVKPTRLCHGT